ncbi:hypothetical protein BT93_C1967 [Corymbia citriodora subsp. variegata]|nr:hypothetical protein BT93_C1967 [Corymbia citriodora subsp. variegata]
MNSRGAVHVDFSLNESSWSLRLEFPLLLFPACFLKFNQIWSGILLFSFSPLFFLFFPPYVKPFGFITTVLDDSRLKFLAHHHHSLVLGFHDFLPDELWNFSLLIDEYFFDETFSGGMGRDKYGKERWKRTRRGPTIMASPPIQTAEPPPTGSLLLRSTSETTTAAAAAFNVPPRLRSRHLSTFSGGHGGTAHHSVVESGYDPKGFSFRSSCGEDKQRRILEI